VLLPIVVIRAAAYVDQVEVGMPAKPPRKPLLCRLHLHHKWVRHFNPQHEEYLQCKACGKDFYDVEPSFPTMTGYRFS
jgi:hypothetical protein